MSLDLNKYIFVTNVPHFGNESRFLLCISALKKKHFQITDYTFITA